MATVDRRKTKSGAVTWRVRWHEGGRRTDPLDSETCDHEKDALDFAAMVRLAGERRPEGYPRGCRGRKLVPAEEPAQEPSKPTFAEVVEEYLATLVDAEPRTLAEHRRDLREHVRPAVVLLPGGSAVGPLGELPIDECADPDIWQAWVAYMRANVGAPQWQATTGVRASWTFVSAGSDRMTPLPLMAVRFAPPLNDLNQGPAGREMSIPVHVRRQGGATPPAPVTSLAVKASYDDGTHWLPLRVVREADHWTVRVRNPAQGGVSLRAFVRDASGTTVDQTIRRAYTVD